MADWAMYKPVLTALVLPPIPFLLLILVGARLILPRRGLGYLVLVLGVAGIWLSSCQVTAVWLQDHVLRPAPVLLGPQQARLVSLGQVHAQQVVQAKRHHQAGAVVPPVALIVLGAGREPLAPEYGSSDLSDSSLNRLRYGVWLSRQTGLPLGFSGGVGWGQKSAQVDATEAEVAARVAAQQFNLPLRWVESASSDTRGNAARTVAMLTEQGVSEVVVVTQAFHMPRAHRAFTEAAQQAVRMHPGRPLLKVTSAPLDAWKRGDRPMLDWIPSGEGVVNVRGALKEWLGMLVGA